VTLITTSFVALGRGQVATVDVCLSLLNPILDFKFLVSVHKIEPIVPSISYSSGACDYLNKFLVIMFLGFSIFRES